ncbi:MAG: tetratricopeptide repeat-containing sulfotransferase family protein [Sulfuricaulis sp.]
MARTNVLTRSKKIKVRTLMQAGRLFEAMELCTDIVRVDKLDADAWVMLAVINRQLSSHKESETCARQALALQPDMATAHMALGASLHCLGSLREALSYYRQAVIVDPNLAEAHYLLGNALRELALLDEAVASYRRACALQPDYLAALSNLGATLMSQGQTEEALKFLNHALKLAPASPQVLCNVGELLERDARFDEARYKFQQALAVNPNFIDALAALAALDERQSRIDAAKAQVAKGLALAPTNVSLITTAAKIARIEGRHQDAIDLLERLMAQQPTPAVAGELHINLGALYDRVGDTDRAFHSFTEGNRLVAEVLLPKGYDRGAYRRRIDGITAFFTDTLPNTWDRQEDDLKEDSPVFLMGFARSGTTLLDQILDSHPQLQTLSERPTVHAMQEAFIRLAGNRPDALANLSKAKIDELRKVYFDTASQFVQLNSKRLLIDKMPLNTPLAHLIWRIFPHAKFILAIRHPCDVCLSCFMQHFALNEAMTTFHTMPSTVGLYTHVMSLWKKYAQVLPINYHRIRYEDLVADFEGEAGRLLGFLEVEWNDAILNYAEHAKTRAINTPSYHQVTQPIYQHAKYRWKRYAKHLEPYLPALASYIEYFGYAEQKN